MTRTETDRSRLRNRCSACGHRLIMHTADGKCCVLAGKVQEDPDKAVQCRCGRE